MFREAGFNSDISSWDVSSVSNMRGMFSYQHNFNQDLSSWRTCRVTDSSGIGTANNAWASHNKPRFGAPCILNSQF